MTDRPIIFSAPMVRALLEGRKTMTRRLATVLRMNRPGSAGYNRERRPVPSPWRKVAVGDRLWVREACGTGGTFPPGWAYRADGVEYHGERWLPSIHMPRRASRLTLTVTAARTERLHEIRLPDVRAEGCEVRHFWLFGAEGEERHRIARCVFQQLWTELHGAESWAANPEVVVLTFAVARRNIDAKVAA